LGADGGDYEDLFRAIEENKQRKCRLHWNDQISKASELIGPGEVDPSGNP
jgi:hypothetical protein